MKKETLIESFQRAAKDPEMLELADQGLSDYLDQLSHDDHLVGYTTSAFLKP